MCGIGGTQRASAIPGVGIAIWIQAAFCILIQGGWFKNVSTFVPCAGVLLNYYQLSRVYNEQYNLQ